MEPVRAPSVRGRRAALLILLGLCLSLSPAASPAASSKFPIATRGQAKAEILLDATQPEPPLAFAAEELRRYLRQISGADLPVARRPTGKPAILLIHHPAHHAATNENDPRDEDRYKLTVASARLEVEGASPRAVLFGVYDLLERLGCGWCVPGDEVVPRRDILELRALEVDARPAFSYRMLLDFPMQTAEQTIAIADWLAKNRLNWIHECPNAHGEPQAWYDRRDRVLPELRKRGLRLLLGGHTMHTWLPETEFKAHPEWFASDAGERKPPTLCVANAEMTAELIKNMRHFLDRCPEVDVIDLWHPDGEVFCHCAKCTRGVARPEASGGRTSPPSPPPDALQSAYVISYVEFVNRVAGAIVRSHPRVLVSPLIYSQTEHAMPDAAPALADNVFVGLAHFQRDSFRPLAGEPKSSINTRFLGNDLTWIRPARGGQVQDVVSVRAGGGLRGERGRRALGQASIGSHATTDHPQKRAAFRSLVRTVTPLPTTEAVL